MLSTPERSRTSLLIHVRHLYVLPSSISFSRLGLRLVSFLQSANCSIPTASLPCVPVCSVHRPQAGYGRFQYCDPSTHFLKFETKLLLFRLGCRLQESLTLSTEEAQEALVSLLESRAKGILKNVKADAMERRDANILKAAERLLK